MIKNFLKHYKQNTEIDYGNIRKRVHWSRGGTWL